MERIKFLIEKNLSLLLAVVLLGVLYWVSLSNYLLFHSLAELFSILIAGSVFILAWSTRKIQENSFLMFLGIAFFFVAGLDMFHTLAYKGMGVIAGDEANLATQIWIAARSLQATSWLLAPFFLRRKLPARLAIAVYAAIFSLLVLSIFYWKIFPVAYVEGRGLTPFKVISEYVIILVLGISLWLLWKRRSSFPPSVVRSLEASLLLSMASELAFTQYISVYGQANLLGHILKILAFGFVYSAIIESSLTKPYSILFQNLNQVNTLLGTLFHVDPGGLAVLVGPELKFQFTNPAYRLLTPHPELDPVGRLYEEVWPTATADDHLVHRIRHVLLTSLGESYDRYERQQADGSKHFFKLSLEPIRWGDQPAVLLVYWDTTHLERSIQDLRLSEARERARVSELEAIMDAVPASVWVARDPQCRDLVGNRAAYDLLQLPFGVNPVGLDNPPYTIHRKGVPLTPEQNPLVISASQGVEIHGEEQEIVFKNGQRRNLFGNVTPLLDEQGRPRGAVAAFLDITDFVATRQALEHSNRELEQFAFVASHDLQEPLRKIRAFSDRLSTRLQDRLDDEERDSLARIQSAVLRMQAMIHGLLELSRVTSRGQPFVQVDLDQLARDVVSDLEMRLQESRGSVTIEPLPVIEADPLQMRQLLQNLVGNALKFSQKDIPPVVTISAHQVPGSQPDAPLVCLQIRDNGIGLEMQFAEQIFEPFSRLQHWSEYEGSGMGLAICRKIVARHHGRISVDSLPGEGSKFMVELPVKQSGPAVD